MAGKPVGIAYAEIDLDSTKMEQGLKRTHDILISGSIKVEDAYKSLGIKSDQVYNMMRANATAAVDFIKNKTLSSKEEIVRAEKAAADRIKSINDQQFGAQTSLIDSLKKNWMALSAAAIATWMAVQKAYSFGKNIAEAANEIQRMAEITGLSTDAFQKMQYAAKMADIDVNELSTGMKMLSKNLDVAAEITGDASIKMKPLDEIMSKIADKFQSWEDGPRKIAISMALFGRSGEALIPYLNKGSAGLREFYTEAERLGIVLDSKVIKEGSRAEDVFKRLEAQIEATKLSLAPAALEFAKFIDSTITEFKKLDPIISKIDRTLMGPIRRLLGFGGKSKAVFEIEEGLPEKLTLAPEIGGKAKETERGLPSWLAASKAQWDREQEALEKMDDTITVQEQGWTDIYKKVETELGPAFVRQWGTIKETVYWVKDLLKAEEDRKKNLELINKAYMEYEYKNLNRPKEIPIEYHPDYGTTVFPSTMEAEKKAKEEAKRIQNFWDDVTIQMGDSFSNNFLNLVHSGFKDINDFVKNVGSDMLGMMEKLIMNAVMFGNIMGEKKVGGGYGGVAGWLGGLVKDLFTWGEGGYMPGSFIPIKAMSGGGYFDRPTLGLIAEKGEGEYVIPKSKMGGMGVGGGGSNITYIQIVANDSKSFMDMVHRNEGGFVKMVTKHIRNPGIMRNTIRGT